MAGLKKNQSIILVDGSSYLFRAYYALPPLTNKAGHPTGAIYGVTNMMRKLCEEYQHEQIIVVFDSKGKNFRHELYPEYKANRGAMPEELGQQIEPIHNIIRAMGLPLVMCPGVEADDIIGTLCTQAAKENIDCIVSSGDKDFAQLVNPSISLVNTMTQTMMDEQGVVDKFGVPPHQIIDYLALIGDTSDNVPGIPKVGPKTAVKWLNQYESIDNLIEHADQIKGKVGENLRENIEQLKLSRQLVTILCDVKLEENLESLQQTPADDNTLLEYFETFEFNRWVDEIKNQDSANKSAGLDQPKTERNYQSILNKKDCEELVIRLKKQGFFAFDLETSGLDPQQDYIVGIALAKKPGQAYYIPIAHKHSSCAQQLTGEWVFEQLDTLFQDESIDMIGQNLKFDLKFLMALGIIPKNNIKDTLLQDYVLDSNNHPRKLEALAQKHLNITMTSYDDVINSDESYESFADVRLDEATQYAAEDADIALQLYHCFKDMLSHYDKKQVLLNTVEWPMVKVLAAMEFCGVYIDCDLLHQQSESLNNIINDLTDKITAITETEFNIDSPKQLRDILFEKMQLPVIKKTKSGVPSTNEEVLQQMSQDHPIAQYILDYRSARKLKSTYTDKLPTQVNPKTNRIHTHYHPTGTSTGRLSSSDPNLQNIPVRTEAGRAIRQAFCSQNNHLIVAADYSQVELRIMAHISKEPNLIQAFKEGKDIHTSTAADIFHVDESDVNADQRRKAKAINFGLIYGMSAFGLAKQLDLGRHEAQLYIDAYFDRYPCVKDYMENTREQARKKQYVETILGRRLYLPQINSSNHMAKTGAERAAINAPMQGSAADIIKKAMIEPT